MTYLVEMFSYGFIQRALAAGLLISVLCAVLGVFLVIRRLSLIGDGLAHVSFGSVSLALFAGLNGAAMMLVSLPIVIIASLGILRLTSKTRIGGDAAIGVVSSLGVSSGVMLAVLGKGYGVDLFSYLFGNILAINVPELLVAAFLFVAVTGAIRYYYDDLVAISFNEELAAVSGVRHRFLNSMLAVLTALTVVLSIKLVGVMLVSSLLILPAATSLQLARSFRMTVVLSVLSAICSVIAGILLSFSINLPTGATIIIVAFIQFSAALGVRRLLMAGTAV